MCKAKLVSPASVWPNTGFGLAEDCVKNSLKNPVQEERKSTILPGTQEKMCKANLVSPASV